jgi:Caspase domain
MTTKTTTLSLFFYFFINFLLAQQKTEPPQLIWERHIGGFQQDEGVMSIETSDGNILMVGTTRSRVLQSSDVYVAKISMKGEVLMENSVGGNRDAAPVSVVQTWDGGYAIAGYTASDGENNPSKGANDAWLIKLNSAGDLEWDKIISTKENDAFTHVIQQKDGSLLAIGYQGKEILYVKYSEKGEEIARQTYQKNGNIPTAVVQDNQGNIVMVGKNMEKGIFLIKIDVSGKENTDFYKVFMDLPLASVNSIIFTKQSKYVLAGKSISTANREDMCVAQLDVTGKMEWARSYGGAGNDYANGIVATFDHQYYFVGATFSHRNSARRSELWFNCTDTLGNELWKTPFYMGGKESDEGNHILQLHNGNFLVTGFSPSSRLLNDAWVIYLKNKQQLPQNNDKNTGKKIVATNFSFHDINQNDTLNANEYGYFALNVTNNNPQDVYDLQLKLPTSPLIAGLSHASTISIGYIARGATQKVSIPLATTDALLTKKIDFPVKLCSHEGDTIATYSIPLKTKAPPHPILRITRHQFLTEVMPAERLVPISLEITLKNTGEGIAKNANVSFALPYKTDAATALSENVGDIQPGDSVKVRFGFTIRSYYEFDSLEVHCSVFERKFHESTSEYVGIKLTDYYEVKETPKIFYGLPKKSPTYKRGGMKNAKMDLSFMNAAGIIDWLAPNQAVEKLDFSHKLNYIDLKLRVIAFELLDTLSFNLFLDEKPVQKGIHFDPNNRLIKKDDDDTDEDFRYTYFNRLTLHEGINNIQLKIKTKNGEAKSKILKIEVILAQQTLHVYSIGIPDNQKDTLNRLKYTTKDAKDFATLFKNQGGGLFHKVTIDTIITKEQTTAGALEELIGKLQEQQQLDIIKNNDRIILFISSHGFMLKDTILRLTASDFTEKRKEKTSIAVEKDILEKLKDLNCTSIVFLDACHSGNPLGSTKSVIKVSDTKKNVYVIASSQGDETSFEDAKWQNGAFTKALIEAFTNQSVPTDKGNITADADKDRVTTLKELFNFLTIRVPAIVKTKQPIPEKLQHPTTSAATMNSLLPIYLRRE